MSLTRAQRDRLKTEIQTDPLGRGYAGLTDSQVIADLNTAYRTRNKSRLTGDEVFQSTDSTEFAALSDGSGGTSDEQNYWISFCARSEIDPFATSNTQFVTNLFGGGSTTVANLNGLRVESITRSQELGLPASITQHQIQQAR